MNLPKAGSDAFLSGLVQCCNTFPHPFKALLASGKSDRHLEFASGHPPYY